MNPYSIRAAAAYCNPDAAFGRRVKNVLHSQTRMYVYFAGSKTQDASSTNAMQQCYPYKESPVTSNGVSELG